MEVLLVLGCLAVAGVFAYYAWRKNQERMAALASLAGAKGWRFEPHDLYGLSERWSGAPFGKGHSRRASNVLTGTIDGRAFVGFDYRYTETHHNGKSRSDTTYHFHVCVLRLPTYLPELCLTPENVLTRIGGALGADDIELESEDFNRQFRVTCGDRKFASDVLTPRSMQALLRSEAWTWRIEGQDLLCYDSGRANPAEILVRTAQMATFIEGIPAFVWKDRGYDPNQPLQGGLPA